MSPFLGAASQTETGWQLVPTFIWRGAALHDAAARMGLRS